MTQEEKSLLLKDLCAGLPYHVKIQISYSDNGSIKHDIHTLDCDYLKLFILGGRYKCHGNIYRHPDFSLRPYLRPMSSMTREDVYEYNNILHKHNELLGEYEACELIDWLNAHHFDYRHLIERGLALEATEDMYKTE